MRIYSSVGEFAGDKDAAAHIRDTYVRPGIAKGLPVELDFSGVTLATQSFVHAMLASIVRDDPHSLDLIEFKGCNEQIQTIIQIVVEYAQDTFD